MGVEIERKFLVVDESWRGCGVATAYRQGYLSREAGRTVRIRRAGEHAFITIKGVTTGASRAEYEYEIPVADAEELLAMCIPPLIDKTRTVIVHEGHKWEVDEFHGENAGLVVAEIELPREDTDFVRPPWVGEEVTHDRRYYNSALVAHPYTKW